MPQRKELSKWAEDELKVQQQAQALLKRFTSALKLSEERWQALAEDLPVLEQATAEELLSYLGPHSSGEAYLTYMKGLLSSLEKNVELQVKLQQQLLAKAEQH